MNLARRRLAQLCRMRPKVEVAREIGVTASFLRKVIRGRKRPGPKVLKRLGLTAHETYRPTARAWSDLLPPPS